MQQLRQKLLSNALANIAQCFAKFRKHCEKKNAKLSQLAQSSHLTPCKKMAWRGVKKEKHENINFCRLN